jgi:hypothetical protein
MGAPVGAGATGAMHVGIAGIAKPNSAGLPFVVANEYICESLGRAILLPIPPGFVIDVNSEPHYVSLNFNLAGMALPPADPTEIVANHPQLAAGIVLFDIWIGNDDRHAANIHYDQASNRIEVFDHSHAKLSNDAADLVVRLGQLAIGGHCLAPALRSTDGLADWANRINQVPEFYIRSNIGAAVDLGLPADRVASTSDYLLQRRPRLLDLLRNNRAAFPRIDPALFDAL